MVVEQADKIGDFGSMLEWLVGMIGSCKKHHKDQQHSRPL
jgi:hypothetical protein